MSNIFMFSIKKKTQNKRKKAQSFEIIDYTVAKFKGKSFICKSYCNHLQFNIIIYIISSNITDMLVLKSDCIFIYKCKFL